MCTYTEGWAETPRHSHNERHLDHNPPPSSLFRKRETAEERDGEEEKQEEREKERQGERRRQGERKTDERERERGDE